MAEERYVKKSEFTGQAVIPISRSEGDVQYVALGDGEILKGDSSDPRGFSLVSEDDLGGGGIPEEIGQVFQVNCTSGLDLDQDTSSVFADLSAGGIVMSNRGKSGLTTPSWAFIDEDDPTILRLTKGTFLVTTSVTSISNTDMESLSVGLAAVGGSSTRFDSWQLSSPIGSDYVNPDASVPDDSGRTFFRATAGVSMSSDTNRQRLRFDVVGSSTQPTWSAEVTSFNAFIARIG